MKTKEFTMSLRVRYFKKMIRIAVIPVLLLMMNAKAESTWSKEAHEYVIHQAFGSERQDCEKKIKQGSAWVDSLANQVASKSYLHAMRSGSYQSIDEAAELMAEFIKVNYEKALDLKKLSLELSNSTSRDPLVQYTNDHNRILNIDNYLEYCYLRGVALHPVMDSTSPAHASFPIWSLSDLSGIFKHGDFPGSIENEKALVSNTDLMVKTKGLIQLVDKIYLEFEMRNFKFILK